MSVIQLKRFGGMAPSANQMFTDINIALEAKNIDLRFKDLRPFNTAEVVATVTAGQSLYRLNGSSTFITNVNDVNYVRGQVAGDTTERTYYTGDGVPKATDITLAVRQLGVPKPATAPIIAVVKNASYSVDDAENAKKYAPSYIFTAVKTGAIQGVYAGLLDADLTDLTATARPWEYSVVRSGSLSGSIFTPTVATDSCLLSPDLEYLTDSTTIKVPLFVRARKFVSDNTTLVSVLTNIPSPDITQPTAKMLNSTQVTALAAGIQAHLASRDAEVLDLLVKVKKEKTDFMALLNNPGSITNLQSGVNASIYTTTPGSTLLASALSNAANAIVQAAQANDGDASLTTGSANTTLQTYIITGADGIKYVNTPSLQTWIYSKIKSTILSKKYDNMAMQNEARVIAYAFAEDIGAIQGNSSVQPSELAPVVDVTASLVRKQASLESYIKKIESIYLDILDDGLQAAITELFVRNVESTFPVGTPSIVTARAYVETYVTDWGEESAPSAVSNIVELDQNDSSTVTLGSVPSGRNITKRRLWRSSTGSSTSAFMFQGEYASGTTVIADTKPDSLLGEACPTFGWAEPPAALRGLVGMTNGVMLGFEGNTVYACEPYAPYAWPAKYAIALESPVVGIAVAGQTAVVTTTGATYLISGADSMSLSSEKLPLNQSCMSKRSMVAIGGTIIYASPDGLVAIQGGAASIITKAIMSKDDWLGYSPSTIVAAEHEGKYCAFCILENLGPLPPGVVPKCLVFDLELGSFVEMPISVDAVFSDKATDTLYILRGTQVKNFLPITGTPLTMVWSKQLFLPAYESFGWLAVEADFAADNSTAVTVVLWMGSSTNTYTATVTNNTPVRIPGGRYKFWKVHISSAITVAAVTLASSTGELKKVAI